MNFASIFPIYAMSRFTNKEYYIIGLMSGTSLDGLDIAYCKFTDKDEKIHFEIIEAETVKYETELKVQLGEIGNQSAAIFNEFDRKIGKYFGECVRQFIEKHKIEKVDFVSSHGHTIFHQPNNGFTVQIGHGSAIAAACNLKVVCDFRSKDVALGGQGAPLVPIGDLLLFPEFMFCLNIGGIANITVHQDDNLLAFDIAAVNIVLNHLANKFELEYDPNGEIASSGIVNQDLLNALENDKYYSTTPPKSLGREWVNSNIFPLLERYNFLSTADILATYNELIANQIAKSALSYIKEENIEKMLITGGGAFNSYLSNLLNKKLDRKCEIIIPDEKTVNFKEAVIFAFLGLLRVENQINCLNSVTGASSNNIGGCIYL